MISILITIWIIISTIFLVLILDQFDKQKEKNPYLNSILTDPSGKLFASLIILISAYIWPLGLIVMVVAYPTLNSIKIEFDTILTEDRIIEFYSAFIYDRMRDEKWK